IALKLRAQRPGAQGGGATDKEARQRGNTILPYLRAPGSFKRMLGSAASEPGGSRCSPIGLTKYLKLGLGFLDTPDGVAGKQLEEPCVLDRGNRRISRLRRHPVEAGLQVY